MINNLNKRLLTLGICFFSCIMMLTSCEQCMTCQIQYSIQSVNIDTFYVAPEECGNKKFLDEREAEWTQWAQDTLNGTISCIRE